MQDRYVGDVGDFGKYGLLRWLCGQGCDGTDLRLGVLWYRFEGKERSNDGGHTQYICCPSRQESQLRKCDPELFRAMRNLVVSGRRSISEVEAGGVLPPGTLFYNRGLSFENARSRGEREAMRTRWLESALVKLADAEVIFADPDNGLEIPSCGPLNARGPKFAFYGDLREFWKRGQSLIVYHHIGRTHRGLKADAAEQICHRREELERELGDVEPVSLRFRRRSPRVYFVLPAREHADALNSSIEEFLDSPWGKGVPPHFEGVGC